MNPLSTAFQRMQTEEQDLGKREVRTCATSPTTRPGRRPDRQLRRHAPTRWCRPPRPGRHAAKTWTCARHIRVGRYHHGPTSRGHLWHELSLHARAGLSGGVTTVIGGMVLICAVPRHVFRSQETGSSFASANRRKNQILHGVAGAYVSAPPPLNMIAEWSGSHRSRRRRPAEYGSISQL